MGETTSRGIRAREVEEKRMAKRERGDVKERIFAVCDGKAGGLVRDDCRSLVSLVDFVCTIVEMCSSMIEIGK